MQSCICIIIISWNVQNSFVLPDCCSCYFLHDGRAMPSRSRGPLPWWHQCWYFFNDVAYPACEKAAKAKGKDLPADLECIKYFQKVEKECWPCICEIAHAAHWTVKGCWFIHQHKHIYSQNISTAFRDQGERAWVL